MSLTSMTGFGRGEASASGVKVEVELSSVNRKQFDARISLPRQYTVLESRIYELIHKSINRGHVHGAVKVSAVEQGRARRVIVDEEAAAAYVKSLRSASKKLGLQDDLSSRSLLSLPDVVRFAGIPEDPSKVWPMVRKALTAALRELHRMEKDEGAALEKDLVARLSNLRKLHARIERHAPAVLRRYRKALRERLKQAGVPVDGMTESLVQEIAVFADRSDISEEITRLGSHFDQADELVKSRQPVGRALDFLCQEMLREINTIGSKANDAKIAAAVVHFKTGLESVREQVQNIQ